MGSRAFSPGKNAEICFGIIYAPHQGRCASLLTELNRKMLMLRYKIIAGERGFRDGPYGADARGGGHIASGTREPRASDEARGRLAGPNVFSPPIGTVRGIGARGVPQGSAVFCRSRRKTRKRRRGGQALALVQ